MMGPTFNPHFWQGTDPNTYLNHHVGDKAGFREAAPPFQCANAKSKCVYLQKKC